MFERIRIRIPVLIKYRVRIPVFKKIRSVSTFWKDKFRIPMLIKIGKEFSCLEQQN